MDLFKTAPLIILILTFSTSVFSQQMVYQPINPSFGGNPGNYSWLLSSAGEQNPFKDDDRFGMDDSALSNFEDTFKRQILNDLTRSLSGNGLTQDDEPLGSDQNKTFEGGGLFIDIDETPNGPLITIIDTETGESTEIIF